MYTRSERKAMAIGRRLANVLLEIETFNDDPDMIIEEAQISLSPNKNAGASDALMALANHYSSDTKSD